MGVQTDERTGNSTSGSILNLLSLSNFKLCHILFHKMNTERKSIQRLLDFLSCSPTLSQFLNQLALTSVGLNPNMISLLTKGGALQLQLGLPLGTKISHKKRHSCEAPSQIDY